MSDSADEAGEIDEIDEIDEVGADTGAAGRTTGRSRSEEVRLRLEQIRTDGGTQPRAGLDEATVREYAAAMREGVAFPPVTVFYDGARYWLADGFHRHAAALGAGQSDVACDMRQGTRRDAILHSVGANAEHGLRRSNADKRRAVETLLRDGEWRVWNDHQIARACRVDPKTVGNVRRELVVSGEIPATVERIVLRGGTTYTVDAAKIAAANAERAALGPESVARGWRLASQIDEDGRTRYWAERDGARVPGEFSSVAALEKALTRLEEEDRGFDRRRRPWPLTRAVAHEALAEDLIQRCWSLYHDVDAGLWWLQNDEPTTSRYSYNWGRRSTPDMPTAELAIGEVRALESLERIGWRLDGKAGSWWAGEGHWARRRTGEQATWAAVARAARALEREDRVPAVRNPRVLAPHLLWAGEQEHPYRLPTIHRLRALHHNEKDGALTTVRVVSADGQEVSRQPDQVWLLRDDAAWQRAQAIYRDCQAALTAIADELERLGPYARRLSEAGGAMRVPNPLTSTAIAAPDPAWPRGDWVRRWEMPRVVRVTIERHTPKMLRVLDRAGAYTYATGQSDHFVCPDEAAWERVRAAHECVRTAQEAWHAFLREAGTYEDAFRRRGDLASATPGGADVPGDVGDVHVAARIDAGAPPRPGGSTSPLPPVPRDLAASGWRLVRAPNGRWACEHPRYGSTAEHISRPSPQRTSEDAFAAARAREQLPDWLRRRGWRIHPVRRAWLCENGDFFTRACPTPREAYDETAAHEGLRADGWEVRMRHIRGTVHYVAEAHTLGPGTGSGPGPGTGSGSGPGESPRRSAPATSLVALRQTIAAGRLLPIPPASTAAQRTDAGHEDGSAPPGHTSLRWTPRYPNLPPPDPDDPAKRVPLVPGVLVADAQRYPYTLPPIARRTVLYEREGMLRLRSGPASGDRERDRGVDTSKAQRNTWCIPDDASWDDLQAGYAAYQAALDAFALELHALGSYVTQLVEAGGYARHPEPLTATAIAARDPDGAHSGWETWAVPPCHRVSVYGHTAQMLEVGSPIAWLRGRRSQRDHFVCPDEAAWERVEAAHAAVEAAHAAWTRLLAGLGTYAAAKAALADPTPGTSGAGVVPPTWQPSLLAGEDEENGAEWDDGFEGFEWEDERGSGDAHGAGAIQAAFAAGAVPPAEGGELDAPLSAEWRAHGWRLVRGPTSLYARNDESGLETQGYPDTRGIVAEIREAEEALDALRALLRSADERLVRALVHILSDSRVAATLQGEELMAEAAVAICRQGWQEGSAASVPLFVALLRGRSVSGASLSPAPGGVGPDAVANPAGEEVARC